MLQEAASLNKVGILITVFVVGFLALLIYNTVEGQGRFRVQVCMQFQTKTACKTVSSKAEDTALRSAINNACADIAAGMNETMSCERLTPQTIKWLKRP